MKHTIEPYDFRYEDLQIGQKASFSREITESMMESFRALSGDENPLHCDVAFAQEKGFSNCVVYGMLTASMYSCLGGVYIPGRRCLLQSVHADFLRPVFIGDVLEIHGEITHKSDSVRQVVIKAEIRNQNGQKVSKAKIEAGVI